MIAIMMVRPDMTRRFVRQSARAGRSAAIALVCAVSLSACVSLQDTTTAPAPFAAETPPPSGPALGMEDSKDDLALGKRHFRESNFGLAEVHFRRAVEKAAGPKERDAEAWLGLAASYDRLRRFELADRAYDHAIGLLGPTPEVLNNRGYSYLLRGDYKRARAALTAALAKDPGNSRVQNNVDLLERSAGKRG
jgi:Tfp pilus assembly protein PilF